MGSADQGTQDRDPLTSPGHERTNLASASLRSLEAAVRDGVPARAAFQRLHEALAKSVGFKVLTVLKLDPTTLRSVRLYSSEPSYPVGGTKQHLRSGWSDAILDRRKIFVAHDCAALRAAFPDSAAIEATGCGSIVAVPILDGDAVVGTMNLWHRDGYYDEATGLLAVPFANAIAPIVRNWPSQTHPNT
jgi:transcriptional regulator with GAF, ATPase, and Fis domain